jgi:hypothetical protein
VYGGMYDVTHEVTVEILCCRSGDSLAVFLLSDHMNQFSFIPESDHEFIFSSSKSGLV